MEMVEGRWKTWIFMEEGGFSWRKEEFREFGEGDGKKRENGEKEDEDGVEVKECDK